MKLYLSEQDVLATLSMGKAVELVEQPSRPPPSVTATATTAAGICGKMPPGRKKTATESAGACRGAIRALPRRPGRYGQSQGSRWLRAWP